MAVLVCPYTFVHLQLRPPTYFIGLWRNIRVGDDAFWNNFDFFIVTILWIPGEIVGGNIAFLRLLRLMRLFKLVEKIKQLAVIMQGLIKGLGSVVYIILLMLLIFFLFAIVGVTTFRRNDPWRYGGLGIAMLSLFTTSTLEGWTSVLYTEFYGCDSQHVDVDGVRARIELSKSQCVLAIVW